MGATQTEKRGTLSQQRRLRVSLWTRAKKETSANRREYATNSPLSMTSQTVAGDQSQLAAPEKYQRKLRIQDVSRETISSDFSTCLQAQNEALQSSIWGIASLEHTSFTAQEVDALDRFRSATSQLSAMALLLHRTGRDLQPTDRRSSMTRP